MGESRIKLLHLMTVPVSLRFLHGQPTYFRQHGIDSVVITSDGELLTEFAEQENVAAYPVEMQRAISPLADLIALSKILRIIRAIRPDIIHAHTPKGGLLGMIGGWLGGVPKRIYHVHGLPLETATGLKLRLLTMTEKLSCRLATQVLCVSPSLRDAVLSRKLCSPTKISVVGNGSANGIDGEGLFNPDNVTQSQSEIRAELNIPHDAAVIGFVGRFVRDKGVTELKAAWDIIRADYPNAYLLVVGGMEGEHSTMDDIFQALEKDPRARMIGFIYDLKAMAYYYKAMDFLVCPSYREGMSLAPLEAASMEIPTIATDITGNRDAVQDGVTGTLIPVRTVERLVDAMRIYLEQDDLRTAHGRAGRERILTLFRPEIIWQYLYKVYTGEHSEY